MVLSEELLGNDMGNGIPKTSVSHGKLSVGSLWEIYWLTWERLWIICEKIALKW